MAIPFSGSGLGTLPECPIVKPCRHNGLEEFPGWARMRPVLAVVLALAIAGCFGDDPAPAERSLSASGGVVSAGWAYDGAGVIGRDATLSGVTNDPENVGAVNASFALGGSTWTVVFDQFGGSQEFMDGGVEFDLTEHGDSGVADASIPKIRARIAAWGTATVLKDGVPVAGAKGDRWAAHLMVSEDTVRGADGRILNAAGNAPYDPAKPADARVVTDDSQALLKLVHPGGEGAARATVNASTSLAFAGPESTQTVDIPSEAGALSLVVNVTVSGPQSAPLGVGQATLTLKDAGGNATKTTQLTLAPNQPATASFALAGAEVTGPFTLEVKGVGAFTASVDYVVTFDDHPFIVVTWNDVTTA